MDAPAFDKNFDEKGANLILVGTSAGVGEEAGFEAGGSLAMAGNVTRSQFEVSDAAAMINGENLLVDDGYTAQ